MKNKIKLLNLAITIATIFFVGCENDIDIVNSVTSVNKKKQPNELSRNVAFFYSDSARVRSKLKSPLVEHYMGVKPYYEMNKGLEVIFFDSIHKEQSKLNKKNIYQGVCENYYQRRGNMGYGFGS